MNRCTRCIELETFFDRQIKILHLEIKKRDQALESQEFELVRLQHLVKWFTQQLNYNR